MAAIDFPASPTTGQLFSAANGVTYIYNGTIWIVQAGPGGGTGDFCAYTTANFSLGALVTLIPTGITSGNAGSWYNTTTGRYTPPAGRYRILGWLNSFNAGASLIQLIMRKNGASIGISGSSVAFQCTAAAWTAGTCDLVIDANGSDFFDFQASAGAGSTSNNFTFTAFPLTGMAGPMGPPFGGGTGDFFATSASTISLPTTGVTPVVFPTVTSGNAGTTPPYNTATGRYTPPAGRYYLYSFGTFSQGAVNTMGNCYIRKNGVTLASSNNQLYAANANAEVSVSVQADANGTDYFDIAWQSTQTNGIVAGGTNGFGAFPLTGMAGPMGPPSGGGTGDFCANQTSAFPAMGASFVQLILTQVLTGNSGGWYNTTTGRYTPPAGRYFIQASYSCTSSAAASHFDLLLRKNGTAIASARDTANAATWYACPEVSATFDANGTDYFDIYGANSGGGTANFSGITFLAYPLTGMQGPAGSSGVAANRVKFTSFLANGTWTPDANMLFGQIVGMGGGGAGAGTGAGAVGYNVTAAGGSSGTKVTKFFNVGSLAASYAVTIGAGGASNSAVGGNTTVGALLTATGGNGVTGSVGDNIEGQILGSPGMSLNIANSSFAAGNGGGYGGGYGAAAGVGAIATGQAGTANTGGGGGGGAANSVNTFAGTGGAGGSGYVYIHEYLK